MSTTDPAPGTSTRSVVARALLAAYFLALVLAVLAPSSAGPSALLVDVREVLADWGLPSVLNDPRRTEIVANVAIVVPVGALGSLAFPALRWQDWATYAFVGALGVELTQGLLLPGRDMSATDVVANTLGALLGAVAIAVSSIFRDRRAR